MFKNQSAVLEEKHFSWMIFPSAFVIFVFRHFIGISSATNQIRFCETTTLMSVGSPPFESCESQIVMHEACKAVSEAVVAFVCIWLRVNAISRARKILDFIALNLVGLIDKGSVKQVAVGCSKTMDGGFRRMNGHNSVMKLSNTCQTFGRLFLLHKA